MTCADQLIISFDRSGKDDTVLMIGRKVGRGYKVINDISGKEAEELYNKLTKKEK